MTAATLTKPAPPKSRRPTPAHYLANGKLYRAIVSLPQYMCRRDRPLQERWVFFDCCTRRPAEHLESLLTTIWGADTHGWADAGLIYNVTEASDLIAQNDADDDTALFERAWGSEGTQYVAPADVDFFVRPEVRAVLEAALARVTSGKLHEGGAA
ncbi:hypothetical protein [Paracidovorax wautersii]|uniref:Uncharacterized protein n=1 Tax=Paracidovorax wautersii TaxID=1177982 RepID=A0A1I2GBA8_9BURK|nr:hypothetical protein [Paracidovorax wautersii]SFF15044.1 hypothetical protein SAMN04489711_11484 [Paracidovorax wautersii]